MSNQIVTNKEIRVKEILIDLMEDSMNGRVINTRKEFFARLDNATEEIFEVTSEPEPYYEDEFVIIH